MQSNFITENKPFVVLLVIPLILLIKLLFFSDKPDPGDVVKIVVDDTSVSIPPEFDQELVKRDTEGVAFFSNEGKVTPYKVKRNSPTSLDPIDLCVDSLEVVGDAASCTRQLTMTSFVQALSLKCYSCVVAGVQRNCHRSGTYYKQWPCSETEGSSYHPTHDVDTTLCLPLSSCQ